MKGKNHPLLIAFIFMLVLSSIMTGTVASATTIMKADPSAVKANVGETFAINITILDVEDLFAWQFRLIWNASLLDIQNVEEEPFLKTGGVLTLFVNNTNQVEGWVDVVCTRTGEYTPGVDGSGNVVKLTFLVEGSGDSILDLTNTELVKEGYISGAPKDQYRIPHEVQDGYFSTKAHDVAVTNVTVSQTWINPGDLVTISVTVENQGVFTETFNVTIYYDETAIENKSVTLDALKSTVVTFVWNTTGLGGGDFIIKAVASFVPFETEEADNTFIYGKVGTPRHDVAVINITTSPKQVTPGQSILIDVEVENQGNYTETFNVKIYYDSELITTLTATDLAAGASTTLSYNWDTTGVAEGDYLIEAVADTVPEETYTLDNTFKMAFEDAISIASATQMSFPLLLVGIGIAVIAILIGVFMMRRRFSSNNQ